VSNLGGRRLATLGEDLLQNDVEFANASMKLGGEWEKRTALKNLEGRI
jgi:hypothetical protein